MLAVKWLVVRCVMHLFRLPNYRMTQLPVGIWWFSNRTKYITHRTTSHLTVDIWRCLYVLQDLWLQIESTVRFGGGKGSPRSAINFLKRAPVSGRATAD